MVIMFSILSGVGSSRSQVSGIFVL